MSECQNRKDRICQSLVLHDMRGLRPIGKSFEVWKLVKWLKKGNLLNSCFAGAFKVEPEAGFSPIQRSTLIAGLLAGFPAPSLLFVWELKKAEDEYTVLHGMEVIKTLYLFMGGKFALPDGRFYNDLDAVEKIHLDALCIPVQKITVWEDGDNQAAALSEMLRFYKAFAS